MTVYTVGTVERVLRNLLEIRYTLEGKGQVLPDTYAVKNVQRRAEDNIFTVGHARPPMDGKARARFMEELHVMVLDIEQALHYLSDDDVELLYKYHILGTHNLDMLMQERNVTSRGSMQQRVYRAVQRLVRELEKAHE